MAMNYIAVETSDLLECSTVVGVFTYAGIGSRYDLDCTQSHRVLDLNVGDHVELKGSELQTISAKDTLKIQCIRINEDIIW
jgi:hypothetical protein